jgi:tetratricopeptide (TPR) repeat protein
MKRHVSATLLCLAALTISADLTAAGKQTQAAREPDMCVVPPGAQPLLPAKLLPGMGDTRHFLVTTTSDEARRFFLQGLSQIHSFWFVESERSCLQAATLDPDMAMAHWCIALSAASDYRPAFQLLRTAANGGRASASPDAVARTLSGAAIDPQIRAKEAIEKAMSLRDKVTPRERLYIESQAARRSKSDPKDADAAYVAGLRKLVAAFPDDLDARSMLGLALDDGFEPVTKAPREHTLEAIRMLEGVVAADDSHFGAHHYLIHAYEGSKTPDKAWRDCERYAALVPNIPHALHMPGHIYAQSDKIPDAIAAFTAAAENELTWLKADTLYPNGHHGHNVHFLVHALNLAGKYQDSIKWTQHLMTFKETPREKAGNNQRTAWRQAYFALIKTLVRFERWDDILDGRTIPVYDKPEQQAWRQWAMGLAYAAKGQFDHANSSLAELKKQSDRITSATEPIYIAAIELEATIEARSGKARKGFDLFKRAAEREAAMLYTEPPSYPRPVTEAFGNVAIAVNDYAAAERAYRSALEQEPGSGRAYFGLAVAQQRLGKADAARESRERALKAWAGADADLPQLTATSSSAPQR